MSKKNENAGIVCVICIGIVIAIFVISYSPALFIGLIVLAIVIYLLYRNNKGNKKTSSYQSSQSQRIVDNTPKAHYSKPAQESDFEKRQRELLASQFYYIINDFAIEHINKNFEYEEISSLKNNINTKGFTFNHDEIIKIVNKEISNKKNQIGTGKVYPNKYYSGNTNSEEKKTISTMKKVLVDINNDPEEVIASLPGIGPIMAKKTINIRKSNNGFSSFEEFSMSLGIKPHIAKELESQIIIRPMKEINNEGFSGRVVDM